MTELSQEEIEEIIGGGYKPTNKHVRWLEYTTTCLPGTCGSSASISVDDKPMCLMHAFRAVDDLLNTYAPIGGIS